MSFGARALIRLDALRHNLQVIRETAPAARVMAVIKANAYGHGLLEVARALSDVDSLAVARLGEAQSLRAAGIDVPVVILEGIFDSDDLDIACRSNFEIVIHCAEQLAMLEKFDSGRLTVWLKFDTGMNRLGFPATDANLLIGRARECSAISNLRLMTHLANADDRGDNKTVQQLELFQTVSESFEGDISVANSAVLFGWTDRQLKASADTWIRPGVALYGITPLVELSAADLGLRPVMQFESRLIAVKAIGAGDPVGYGGAWRASEDSVIGIVSAGYGDGYPRQLPSGTPVLVNDRRVLLVGRVSMDMIAVDLGPDATDKFGDRVVLWGDGLAVEEIADCAGTIPYTLVTGVLNREPARYFD